MKETITVSLSNPNGILTAIQQRIERAQERGKLLCERLAEIGIYEASIRFTTAMYDGTNDVICEAEKRDDGLCWVIKAKGEAVCFIEFGAGIYYNEEGDANYPNGRPAGIVGIGEFGKGHGADRTKYGDPKGWWYKDESGEWQHTYGNPAAMPMYYAASEMRDKIAEIAREVFAS